MRLQQLAIDLGAAEGHREYVRFIILSSGRTGSNLLTTSLDSHTRTIAWGELFRSGDMIGWDRWPYDGTSPFGQSRRLRHLHASDPESFLESRVYRRLPLSIAAVGFKLFYPHARQGPRENVWPYMTKHTRIRIIHLKRTNRLRRHLSLRQAESTNSWIDLEGDGGDRTAEPIRLDFEDCQREFALQERREREHDGLFAAHPALEVFYEDLDRDFSSEMERLQGFLGLELEELEPITFKQSHRPLSEAIINYSELKRSFRDSPWESFFEE